MSEARARGQVIYDNVHLWTDIVTTKKIRENVDKWTRRERPIRGVAEGKKT